MNEPKFQLHQAVAAAGKSAVVVDVFGCIDERTNQKSFRYLVRFDDASCRMFNESELKAAE
jgi:hypothetical protein